MSISAPMNEAEVIAQLKRRLDPSVGQGQSTVIAGIGDDAAVTQAPPDCDLVMTMDTLVEGVHYAQGDGAFDIGHRLCAVNLSDLAAMGARPGWALLSLVSLKLDQTWLSAFLDGYCALADKHGLVTLGGDTARGPQCLTLQLTGWVPRGQAVYRQGGQAGNRVLVTGHLGAAAVALKLSQQEKSVHPLLTQRLKRPVPRIELGQKWRTQVHAAVDISDGLLSELHHLSTASGVAITVERDRLPLCEPVRTYVEKSGDWDTVLCGGDDYELCALCPADRVLAVQALAAELGVALTDIGHCERGSGVRVVGWSDDGLNQAQGYRHQFESA